jgi:RNA polymerase sigma factor (sigma-70 family)
MRRAGTKTTIHGACAAPRGVPGRAASEVSGPCNCPREASPAVHRTLILNLSTSPPIDIADYLELAIRHARSFRHWACGRGMAWEDLVGEARLALVCAATKFNPARGRPFASFASAVIRNALVKAVRRHQPHRSLTNSGRRAMQPLARPLPDPDAAADVQSLLRQLTSYERTLVEQRFGLADGEERDTRQLAVLRQIREEQVSRILHRVLTAMRWRVGLLAGALTSRCMRENPGCRVQSKELGL